MSVSLASRVAPYCVALASLLVAGSARAQLEQCFPPEALPDALIGDILDDASFDFGDTTEKACTGVVKDAIKTCKAQVKGAQKCFDRGYDGLYKIGLKQCQALEGSEDRAECKAEFKAFRDGAKSNIALDTQAALADCESGFAESVSASCLNPP